MIPTLRPSVQMLAPAFVEKIIDEALTVLEREGVFVENAAARALFRQAGAPVDETTFRVRIGRPIVENALAATPSSVRLYDRTGRTEYVVGGDVVHFDPGSAAVKIVDFGATHERAADTRDLVNPIFFCKAVLS